MCLMYDERKWRFQVTQLSRVSEQKLAYLTAHAQLDQRPQIWNFDWAIDMADCWRGKIMDFSKLNLSSGLSFFADIVDI